MISFFQLVRNIGKFDSVSSGATLALRRLSLIYGENSRGKTTLSAILRSLGSGDPVPIQERQRLGATNAPHIVVKATDAPSPIIFQNGAWARSLPNITVFDDAFVNENVYSGLAVDASHRQNLHELILGVDGVRLNNALQALAARIEVHNGALRTKSAAIPSTIRGPFNIEEFCSLQPRPDIAAELLEAERNLAAAKEHDAVVQTPELPRLSIPAFDIADIQASLAQSISSLDAAAAASVRAHIDALAGRGESWIERGLNYMPVAGAPSACPFCAQDLESSAVFAHYRAYFGEAYSSLRQRVAGSISSLDTIHGEAAQIAFERSVRQLNERTTFWARFTDVPRCDLDIEKAVGDWRRARDAIGSELRRKQEHLLEELTLADSARELNVLVESSRSSLAELNERIDAANASIAILKQRTAFSSLDALDSNLARLKATGNRQKPEWIVPCNEYIAEKSAEATTEQLRDTARERLDQYRTTVFPGYQTAINLYLDRFNAGFRIDEVTPLNVRGGPSCKYSVVINTVAIPVAGGEASSGDPSFRSTLSAGDRNALALAFFFASIDQAPDIANKIAVIDDPMSSFDDHRTLTTVQEIRRLANRVEQVIVLSHRKNFLCSVWVGVDLLSSSAMQIIREGQGSTFDSWRVEDDSATEHDRRHAQLQTYVRDGSWDKREIARAIRHHLEAFLRIAVPEHFPAGTLLGPFRGHCEQKVGTPEEIFDTPTIEELRDLTEYANRFHHETNPSWQIDNINDDELRGYVVRAMRFASRQ